MNHESPLLPLSSAFLHSVAFIESCSTCLSTGTARGRADADVSGTAIGGEGIVSGKPSPPAPRNLRENPSLKLRHPLWLPFSVSMVSHPQQPVVLSPAKFTDNLLALLCVVMCDAYVLSVGVEA